MIKKRVVVDNFEIDKGLEDYHPVLSKLLFNRGIKTREDVEKFLNPSFERDVHDPFLIHDMEKSVERIIKAIKCEEKIAVYNDYDCDGIPGGVVLTDFFEAIGYKNYVVYIPHRHNEGYGLHKHAIDYLEKENVKLIITVDLAITNLEEIIYTKEKNIEIIVTDHHLPIHKEGSEQELPKAFSVLNSKKDICNYPDKNLCGCAVAWKLVSATLTKLRELEGKESKHKKEFKEILENVKKLPIGWEKWLLDMVGISTIADMVPLQNENRALAYFGIEVLRKSRRPGLQHLLKLAKATQKDISEDDIGFTIAPRLNSASRMDIPQKARTVLAENNLKVAMFAAEELENLNNDRKSSVKDITDTISYDHIDFKNDVIVVGDESWGPGVLGLIAQKIIDQTRKPVFVWGKGEGEILKGSCRSIGDIHLVELMDRCTKGTFIHFGGHEQAGGFAFDKNNLEKISLELNEAVKHVEKKEISKDKFEIDAELQIKDVTMELFNEINKLAPFGMGNPKPVFEFKNVKPAKVREFGKLGGHLEIIYDNGSYEGLQAIAFGKIPKDFEVLKDGNPHTLIARIEKSTFMGKTRLRLAIVSVIKTNLVN